MAQISLHDYLRQIDTLLEENRLSEAVAHCRHILKKFPRHVDTYRLYGKALLEQQKYDDAVDIFKRVLSADPEDFIAHVGLGITYKERGKVPEAIWHFERAFEMDPYNNAIQDELRTLYANRDGLRPERINLTRGALARLYFRGHLYRQAAAELRQLLTQAGDAQDGGRLDLQTLLAETLWRDDQRVDVVDVCLRILDKIPYCIKANAILAEVWLVTGRSDEAHEYLQRLRMLTRPEKAHLDPDSVIGRAFNANGIMELPEKVLIDELDYIPVAQEFAGEADWVAELGIGPAAEVDEEASWLDEIEKVDAGLFAEAAASDEEMLDWLREVAVSEEASTIEEQESGETIILDDLDVEEVEATFETGQETPFDWFSEEAETSRESLADVPDWLSEVTASAEADMWNIAVEAGENQEEADEEEAGAQETVVGKAQTPDWIRDVAQENAGFDPLTSWREEDEIPGWMRGQDAGDDFPDWLNETDETAESGDLTGEEIMPGWLSDSEAESEEGFPEFTIEDTVYGLTGEEIPDWLHRADNEELAEETPQEQEFEVAFDVEMDSEFDARLIESIEDTYAMDIEAEAADLPDWLVAAQIESEAEETADFEDLPDWLSGFEQVEQSGEGLPEWLEESPDLIIGQTDIDQDALPDWLDGGDQENMVREELLMGNSEEQENKEPDIPEDLDEAMKWLEELAAEQGADLAELPSLKQDAPAGEGIVKDDDVPDWLMADLSDGELSGEDDLPDWLKQEAESMAGDDWLAPSGEGDLADLDMTAFEYQDSDSEEPASPGNIPDWLKAQMPEDLQSQMSEPESEDLGWLDQIAAGEGAPLEELPTLSWDDEEDEIGFEMEEDDLSWLDDVPEVDVTPMEAESGLPELFGSEADEYIISSVPDDPDEAMAWLEQLAADQGAPLDELPSLLDDEEPEEVSLADFMDLSQVDQDAPTVFEEAEEMEAVADFGVPDDPDEAMAWLERLAAQQGANLDELPTVADSVADSGFEFEQPVVSEMDSTEVPTVFDFPVEDMVEAEVEEPAFDIPDDPDEAMAWLEKLAARQGANLDELPTVNVVEEMATPVTGIVIEAEEFEMDLESEAFSEPEIDPELEMALADLSDIDMPEDDDEALAWLAAITGETAGEAQAESHFEMADEFFEDTDLEPETLQAFEVIEHVETIEITAVDEPLDSFEAEPPGASLFDAIEDETDQFFDSDEELSIDIGQEFGEDTLDSALPDWLKFEPVGETSREDLDWLESFGDSNVDSWLEAEELTSQFDLRDIPESPEPEPVAVPEPELIFDSRAPEKAAEFVLEDFEVEPIPAGPVDEDRLEYARTALEAGDFSSAVEQYNTLLQSGQGLPLLIADLETASNRHTKIASIQRLLGDAYMQNGQLQKAIDTYRQALDNL